MPFGKYGPSKGDPRKMESVPASYFNWLWTEGGKKHEVKTCPVADYINRSLGALKQEYPDGIW